MAIHLYIIESLGSNSVVGMENFRFNASTYLTERDTACTTVIKEPTTSDEMQKAVGEFFDFCKNVAEEDWVVLLLSLHAKPPESPNAVATCGVSAQHSKDVEDVVEWYKAFDSAQWRKRTIVICDVCWGGAPTLMRSMARQLDPNLVFGPVRPAKRFELDTAASLLIAQLEKDKELPLASAKEIVNFLNDTFPSDQNTGTAFYRVWSWDEKSGKSKPYPEMERHKVRIK